MNNLNMTYFTSKNYFYCARLCRPWVWDICSLSLSIAAFTCCYLSNPFAGFYTLGVFKYWINVRTTQDNGCRFVCLYSMTWLWNQIALIYKIMSNSGKYGFQIDDSSNSKHVCTYSHVLLFIFVFLISMSQKVLYFLLVLQYSHFI